MKQAKSAVMITCEVSEDTYKGGIISEKRTESPPISALGEAIARFEDAMLRSSRSGDRSATAVAAFEVAWLARECGLRRGDSGNAYLCAMNLDPPV